MKTQRVIATILLITILACNKDKFQTKPGIEIKSLNTLEVPAPAGNLEIRMEYTDKEGDLGDGTLTYIRIRTNTLGIPNPTINDKVDTVKSAIPEFPNTTKGDLFLNIPYNFMDEDPGRNDTMYFKITVSDIKNNSSDTISTATVVARQN